MTTLFVPQMGPPQMDAHLYSYSQSPTALPAQPRGGAATSRRQRGQKKQHHLVASQTNFHNSSAATPSAPRSYAPSHATSYATLPPSQQQQQQHTASMASFHHQSQASFANLQQQHPGGNGLPPFQFLRLKSFSPHTHAVLRRLEAAILAQPLNPQAYLELGEEYRVLGARHSYLRVLEYGKLHFPHEPEFRTLLYQHLPHRPRTPPPAEPAIQMDRNTMYDYKWRHREANMFPKQILKLDTSVPPYGRQLRQHYLHFLELLRAEETYLTPAKKAQVHAEAIRSMESSSASTARENALALILPPHFNNNHHGLSGATATIVPEQVVHQEDRPVHTPPTSGTPRTNSRKLLSPSVEQRRRESGGPFSPTPPGASPTRRRSSEVQAGGASGESSSSSSSSRRRSSSSLDAHALESMSKEDRAAYELALEEAQERKWKLEEAKQAERERREQEEIAWREKEHAAATERARVKAEKAAAAAAQAEAQMRLEAERLASAQMVGTESTSKTNVTPQSTPAAGLVWGTELVSSSSSGQTAHETTPKDAAEGDEGAGMELTLTGAEYVRFSLTTRSLVKPSSTKVTGWVNTPADLVHPVPMWNQGPGVSVAILAAPLSKLGAPTKDVPYAEWVKIASTEISSDVGVQAFRPLSVDAAFTGLQPDADHDGCTVMLRVTLHSGGEAHKHADVLGEGIATLGEMRQGKPVLLYASGALPTSPISPAASNGTAAAASSHPTVGSISVHLTTALAPEPESLHTLPAELLSSAGVAVLQLNTSHVKKSPTAGGALGGIFGSGGTKPNLVHAVYRLADSVYTPALREKIVALTQAQIAEGVETSGSAWSAALGALLDESARSSASSPDSPSSPPLIFSPPTPLSPSHWSLLRVSEIEWDCSGGAGRFQQMEIPLGELCRSDPYRPLLVQLRHVDSKKLHVNSPVTSERTLAPQTGDVDLAPQATLPPLVATEDVGRFVTNFWALVKKHTLHPPAMTVPAKKTIVPKETDKCVYDCLAGPQATRNGCAWYADCQYLIAHQSMDDEEAATATV